LAVARRRPIIAVNSQALLTEFGTENECPKELRTRCITMSQKENGSNLHLSANHGLQDKAPTAIVGFDEITGGGLPRGRTTLLIRGPGSGKTIFALQFLVMEHGFAGSPVSSLPLTRHRSASSPLSRLSAGDSLSCRNKNYSFWMPTPRPT
jgi:hypothetical protein